MRRVEQQVIEKSHPQYRAIDALAFASKNLWNLANYQVRQAFLFEKHYLNNTALPAKVANQVLLQVHRAWKAFFEAMEVYRACPDKFTGRPKLPKYLHKTQGRSLLIFELGCIWKAELRGREIAVSHLGCLGETKQQPTSVHQVRLVPKADHYVLEVVYEAEGQCAEGLAPDLFVALDPGVNVLAALTSNKPGFVPRLVSGKPVKASNHLYNKQREHIQKQLAIGKEPRYTSHREDSDHDEAQSARDAVPAHRQPSDYRSAGGGRHRRAGAGQEPVLENKRGTREEAQSGIRANSPCEVFSAPHLQSRGKRHPCASHRRELHQQSQLPGFGSLASL